MTVIAKNQYGYLSGMKVVLTPQPGVKAEYTGDSEGAIEFPSEGVAKETFLQNGWTSPGIDWDFEKID